MENAKAGNRDSNGGCTNSVATAADANNGP